MSNEMIVQNQSAIAMPTSDILAFCAQLPERDLVAVQSGIKDVACSSLEMAMACIYCAPVGKNQQGRQKFAMNESVRLAEIAQSKFRHLWVRATTIRMDSDSVSVEALAFDMQTMNTTTATCTRPCYKRPQLAEAAAQSIAKRNAILGHVRPYTQTIMQDIKGAIVAYLCREGEASTSKAWKQIVESFTGKYPAVTEKDLKDITEDEPQTIDKIVLLVGIMNALTDGNVSLDDVFAKDFGKQKFTKTKVQAEPTKPEEKKPVTPTENKPVETKEEPKAPEAKKYSISQQTVIDAAAKAGYATVEEIDAVLVPEFDQNIAMVRVNDVDVLCKFFNSNPKKA